MSETVKKPLEKSDKASNAENKAIRSMQSVGNVKLNARKEFEIISDNKWFKKGDKVKLNAPTEGIFRGKKLIK